MRSLEKVYCVSLEVKFKRSWEAVEIGTEQNALTKSTVAKLFTSCLLGGVSNFNNIGCWVSGPYSIRVAGKQTENKQNKQTDIYYMRLCVHIKD